ncbi:hypothetical protein DSO57_1024184 [Entomophthora muscae]|uniref:Uncharacterized protein n=1 Tax=Entomophthora muscae TaxID=34485 RepID=A0ACC2RTS8_9FUNG|nr:hypothetical protein DSO57_1024184 [Entomophthora muscae]
MFKNVFQSGYLSIFFSEGSHPLQLWSVQNDKKEGSSIALIKDNTLGATVLEITSRNLAKTFISCPQQHQSLGIKLPHIVFIVKNLKKFCSFEITLLDDRDILRRFRASNFQSKTNITPEICTMPLRLDEGWNQIRIDLQDFTKRSYGTNFKHVERVQVHASCRIRRIFFSEEMNFTEETLPPEFRLYHPVA